MRLFDELHEGGKHVEVGYVGDRRVTLEPVHAPLRSNGAPAIAIDRSSVILITGGARGITARAACHLAERYQPTLVLIGRSPLPASGEAAETTGITSPKDVKAALMDRMRGRGEPVTPARVEQAYARLMAEREMRENVARMQGLGARVHYHAVDVRDAEALGALVDGIYSSFGRLDGVIHGAGVIEDKLVQDKSAESFERVFHTKVDSAFVLSRKLRAESLGFLVFFSSVSGRFGNRGQADYAAANEVLNKLAICLDRAWPARVVALNWGPWDTAGMVSAELRKQFAARGVELIPPATGLRMLEEELNLGQRGNAEVIIGGGGWQAKPQADAWSEALPLLGKARLSRVNGYRELIREIDPASDLYLEDHQIDGRPVFPLAVATELIAETVAQGWPEMQVIAVRDLRVFQGIVLENGAKTVRVVATPHEVLVPGSANVGVEIVGTGKSSRVHYRGTVELAAQWPNSPAPMPSPLTDGHPFLIDVPELYRQWLFHGPLFQGIARVDAVGLSGIRAMLMTSSPADWLAGAPPGQWLIDPLMFDSALQLVILWAREHWDMVALPSGFRSFRRFGLRSGPRILCELRMRPNTGGQTIHADIFFMDAENGRTLAVIEDMEGACSKALNRLVGADAVARSGKGYGTAQR